MDSGTQQAVLRGDYSQDYEDGGEGLPVQSLDRTVYRFIFRYSTWNNQVLLLVKNSYRLFKKYKESFKGAVEIVTLL